MTAAMYGGPPPPEGWSPRFVPLQPGPTDPDTVAKLLRPQPQPATDEALMRAIVQAYAVGEAVSEDSLRVSVRLADGKAEAALVGRDSGLGGPHGPDVAGQGPTLHEALVRLASRVLMRFEPRTKALDALRRMVTDG